MLPLPRWVRIISVAVFVVSFIAGIGFVSWYEVGQVRDDTALATFVAIVLKGEAISVVSAATAGTFEGGARLAYKHHLYLTGGVGGTGGIGGTSGALPSAEGNTSFLTG